MSVCHASLISALVLIFNSGWIYQLHHPTNHDWRNKARDDATRAATITEIFRQVVNLFSKCLNSTWLTCDHYLGNLHVLSLKLFGQVAFGQVVRHRIYRYVKCILTGKRYDHFGFAQDNSSYYGKAVGR